MKAIVCNELGPIENLRLEEVDSPKVAKGEVLVEIKAAGVNYPDTLVVQGKYQIKPPTPYIPGVEASGLIAEVGEGVSHWKVGDRVIVTPLGGAFAEYCVVPSTQVQPMASNMSFEQAAGFTITYATSYYALKQRAKLQPGETVLVLGAAGGVGVTCIEIAKAMGATVIAAASSDEKLAFAKSVGADHLINYATESLKDRVKALTAGKGVDVVYDPVGGDLAQQALRSTGWEGRYLVIGFASGDIPAFPANLTLVKGSSVMGVWWGAWAGRDPQAAQQNHMELLAMVEEGRLTPLVTNTFALADTVDAFKRLVNRQAMGKVVITP
ncbi:NADPH:quinone oxidoreductase family protein [Umboniibacter marinipuniceus]|uniref:NADPH2:quinone reductase n=1 Tax=Umboniibacter marinipuniceus TaxID=569599 RepID=A0A3M0AJ01_9GAMM|nr:NADPH:quinone oxidoreductase family protein [Umboniibacter marinipuniceus]RMA82535.1 NADPH2:quinone reductase [Umboniibacter marinipuniceus]